MFPFAATTAASNIIRKRGEEEKGKKKKSVSRLTISMDNDKIEIDFDGVKGFDFARAAWAMIKLCENKGQKDALDRILNEEEDEMYFTVTTVGDMIEGFIDNMSDEQMYKELKLFRRIANKLKYPQYPYGRLGIIIDPDKMIDEDALKCLEAYIGYRPYVEENEASGRNFLYFKNINHAEEAEDFLKDYFKDMQGE